MKACVDLPWDTCTRHDSALHSAYIVIPSHSQPTARSPPTERRPPSLYSPSHPHPSTGRPPPRAAERIRCQSLQNGWPTSICPFVVSELYLPPECLRLRPLFLRAVCAACSYLRRFLVSLNARRPHNVRQPCATSPFCTAWMRCDFTPAGRSAQRALARRLARPADFQILHASTRAECARVPHSTSRAPICMTPSLFVLQIFSWASRRLRGRTSWHISGAGRLRPVARVRGLARAHACTPLSDGRSVFPRTRTRCATLVV